MSQRKKRLYIIPGFGESTRMKNYREISKYARENHFKVVPVKIIWDMNKTMTDYITEASEQIPSNCDKDVLLGFSFGAYIAYVISTKKVFSDYIFCTISPYFKENIDNLPKESIDYFGKRFINDLKKYSLHDGNDARAAFLIGKKDWGLANETNQAAHNRWKGASFFAEIKNAGHELGHNNYTTAVEKILKKLRI